MFLTWMNNRIVWAPEDGAGAPAPAPAAPAAPAPDAGSVLYPDDGPKPAEGAEGGDPKPAEPAAEFVPDPNKSDEENAAAKAEHDAKNADPSDTVPEDGKYNLTMPEGVELDQALLDEVAPQFKELGLTTKQAQALTDKFIAAQTKRAEAQADTWAQTITGWVDQAKADPEIGGAKWDSTVKAASGVVGKFGSPELKEYLNASGAGNHPEMIRFMAKVGAVISEDNPAISENPGKTVARDSAAILYPDDQPKGK